MEKQSDPEKPSYELTRHARDVMRERKIRLEWLEKAFLSPELIEPGESNPLQEKRFRRIPEFGNRVLRVAVNTEFVPVRIVSVFFDRAMKGKL